VETSTILYLRRFSGSQWALYSKTGVQVSSIFVARDKNEAMERAKAWVSSWSGVSVQMVGE